MKSSILVKTTKWRAVKLLFLFVVLGAWEFLNLSVKRLWKGHRRKKTDHPPVQLIDSSVGTHCYIKVMGVKYHYVESGGGGTSGGEGRLVVVLGDAPGGGGGAGAGLAWLASQLSQAGHRTVALDLRGAGGSEGGGRAELAPPRVVRHLRALLTALGAGPDTPAAVVGHGIGGMLVWYLVHCHPELVSRFAVIGAPHPNLHWRHPPAPFCVGLMHFIQWPWLPEHCLAGDAAGAGGDSAAAESLRWAASRAQDWSGPLNYVRGAAWWHIRADAKIAQPALLVGGAGTADILVHSATYCLQPTLRMVSKLNPSIHACSEELPHMLLAFLIEGTESKYEDTGLSPRSLVGRMLGAVAGRGRELTAAVSRARLVLPLSPPPLA